MRKGGFTLIELMVVMLLISVVMAVAVPRFQGGAFQDPVKKTYRWMSNTVRTLRNEAIRLQKPFALAIDLDKSRMWAVTADMEDEDAARAEKQAFTLPGSLKIVNVRYFDNKRAVRGVSEINFYPGGYSDRVVLDLEDDNAGRYSFLIEPLLPKVKIFETWISF